MMLKIFSLLLMISLPIMGLDMRDTSEILDRLHNKSSNVIQDNNTKLKSSPTQKLSAKIDSKSNEISDKNKKEVKFNNELIWEKDSKVYISKKKYNKVLKEFVELNYPQNVEGYKQDREEQKAQKSKDKAQKAKQRKIRAKAKLEKEKEKAKIKKQKKLQKEKQLLQDKIQKVKEKKQKQLTAEEKKHRKKMAQIEARVEVVPKAKEKSMKSSVDKPKQVKVKKLRQVKMKRDGNIVVASNQLMWQDDADVKKTSLSWNDAVGHCENLTLGAYEDWRLPVKNELGSILDKNKKPTINKKFQNVKAASYWSKSDYKNSKYYAWVLYFDSGAFGSYSKKKTSLVRCVRDVK